MTAKRRGKHAGKTKKYVAEVVARWKLPYHEASLRRAQHDEFVRDRYLQRLHDDPEFYACVKAYHYDPEHPMRVGGINACRLESYGIAKGREQTLEDVRYEDFIDAAYAKLQQRHGVG